MAFIIADRVKETSTTTGAGAVTLAGAMTGFSTFAARCAVGDTCYYAIQGVDGSGAPSGEWECGLGTYSAANELTRTTVTSSSNADAVVTLSAGTKHVFIALPAAQVAWMREKLTAARTYYVRTDGSNSNNGLTNTAGGAFLTIQKAVDTICNTLSLQGYTVTVQVADGTYTTPVILKALPDNGEVIIQGNNTTPGNVLISTTSATAFLASFARADYTINDLKITTTTSGVCLYAQHGALLKFSNLDLGACAAQHLRAEYAGNITAIGNYAISGGASSHVLAIYQGRVFIASRTLTITGTPAFTQFAWAQFLGLGYISGNTYSGSATGSYYTVASNGVLNKVADTYPGNSAGTTSTGGQVI